MTSKEKMNKYYGINEDTECCANCAHFYKHYTSNSLSPDIITSFVLLDRGHCAYPRIKDRRLTDVCEHFKRPEKTKGHD